MAVVGHVKPVIITPKKSIFNQKFDHLSNT